MEEKEEFTELDFPHHSVYTIAPGSRGRIWLSETEYEDIGTGMTGSLDKPRNRPIQPPRRPYVYKERICRYCGKAERMGPRSTVCPKCRKNNPTYLAELKAKKDAYHQKSNKTYRQKLIDQGWEPTPPNERYSKSPRN